LFFLRTIMKTLLAVVVGTVPLLSAGVALAQNGTMMNGNGWGGGWMGGFGGMGGYGGVLVPILLGMVVAGLVVLFFRQKGK
jgi:uncharacterized membrane protein